jgi:hypothetical protein
MCGRKVKDVLTSWQSCADARANTSSGSFTPSKTTQRHHSPKNHNILQAKERFSERALGQDEKE